MKAAYLIGHGGNDVVAVGERPMPHRSPGEILVRLKAATVNRVDLYMRDSGAGITHTLPQIMGVDGAGVIEEAVDRPSRYALSRHRLPQLRILQTWRAGALR
jgi:NADPH:quinone reductase-like Zn-dependent oxidoreductase